MAAGIDVECLVGGWGWVYERSSIEVGGMKCVCSGMGRASDGTDESEYN
jgi:hypothetical protein